MAGVFVRLAGRCYLPSRELGFVVAVTANRALALGGGRTAGVQASSHTSRLTLTSLPEGRSGTPSA